MSRGEAIREGGEGQRGSTTTDDKLAHSGVRKYIHGREKRVRLWEPIKRAISQRKETFHLLIRCGDISQSTLYTSM